MESNIISWYDFKIHSKTLFLGEKESELYRCLKERCKKVDVDIHSDDYDYAVILSDEIDYDTLKEAIGVLKKSGILLIAFNNEYGISKFVTYDCKERISPLDKEISYKNSKEHLFKTLSTAKFKYINTYMPFPNYKKTDLILSEKLDDFSDKVDKYFKDYDDNFTIITDEIKLLRHIARNSRELFINLSNSYFIEASREKLNTDVQYVSFNNYRKEEYQLTTIIRDKIVEKRPTTKKAEGNIKRICKNLPRLNSYNFEILDNYEEDTLYSTFIKDKKTLDIELGERYEDLNYIVSVLNDIKGKLLENSIKHRKSNKPKYIEILKHQSDELLDKFHYLEYAFYDMVPKNCFYINDEYHFFDQEWMEKFLPVEFIIYRSVINSYDLVKKIDIDVLLEKLELLEYKELFEKIDEYLRYNVIDNEKFDKLNEKRSKLYEILYDKVVLEQQLEEYKTNDAKQNEYIRHLEIELKKLTNN